MTNPNDFGSITGRLVRDPKVLVNKDGSKSLLMTVARDDNFRSGRTNGAGGEVKTHYLPIKAFVPASVAGNGSWDRLGVGDLFTIMVTHDCVPYQKDGETVYPNPTIMADGFPQFHDSLAVTTARAARRALATSEKSEPVVGDQLTAADVEELKALREAVNGPVNLDPFSK